MSHAVPLLSRLGSTYEIAEPLIRMRMPPHERDTGRRRQRRAIDAARRLLWRSGRPRAQAGAGEQDEGPTALARDALRAIRRESSDGRL
jgi:hypothetical protein